MIRTIKIALISAALLVLTPSFSNAQTYELIPFGDFENWLSRDIEESFIMGGETKRIWEIAPNGKQDGRRAYVPSISSWGNSNAYAVVMGITKTSATVFPEKRADGGRCALLKSYVETAKALGLFNIKVMVSGSIFLGETIEPINDADEPYKKLNMGIPFTKRPVALIYDYDAKLVNHGELTRAEGIKLTRTKGEDCCQVYVYLQNRKENPDGSLTVKRVGTGMEYITKSSNGWQNNHRLAIHYGNITQESFYKPYMKLTDFYYAKNSKGENVPAKEIGWASADEKITHVMIFFSSGIHGAFVGAEGIELRIDNVRFEY